MLLLVNVFNKVTLYIHMDIMDIFINMSVVVMIVLVYF